jgi:hypothetical protein
MPVAKQYQGYKVTKRFVRDGKQFVTIDIPCGKCGGSGYIAPYGHVDGGICFKCWGDSHKYRDVREYTEEEFNKLQAAQDKRYKVKRDKAEVERIARIPEENLRRVNSYGFETDSVYIILGNTYDIKDQLKDAGAKYKPHFGWFFQKEVENFNVCKVSLTDVLTVNAQGYVEMLEDYKVIIAAKKLEAENALGMYKSQYVGAVGQRLVLNLTVNAIFAYESKFGTIKIHKMLDEIGNIFVWKTTNLLEENKPLCIAATIKEHSEYNNEKQTVLTRCKVL